MNHALSLSLPWLTLALLGAYHGLNPAMGWLFALALGLQERRRSAVVGALVPIAVGHAAAIAIAIGLLVSLQYFLPMNVIRWGVAGLLFALGILRVFRASHPRGAGMRVGGKELAGWSFLMASAHGAGLMLLPVLMFHPMTAMAHDHMMDAASAGMARPTVSALAMAVGIHTVSMLLVAGVLALAFFETYEEVGLRLLRHAWLNFDLIWAIALIGAGCAVVLI
jgi:hypothetical protein